MVDRLISDRRAVLLGLGVFGAAAAAPLALNAVQARPALDPIARMDAATAEFVAAAKALDPTIVSFQRIFDVETGACTLLLAKHAGEVERTPQAELQHHVDAVAYYARQVHGGHWKTLVDHENQMVMVARDLRSERRCERPIP